MPVAIVTGGATGIGRGIARSLVANGFDVLICSRSAERLQAAVADLSATGAAVSHQVVDVTSVSSIRQLADTVASKRQPLQVLVNNAGVSTAESIDDISLASWTTTIETNLTGPFLCIKELLPLMSAGSSIVNVSSILGLRGTTAASAYCASKHGLVGLTRSLALDLAARNITVNAIAPGWTDTEMVAGVFESIAEASGQSADDVREATLRNVPMGRMILPEEIGSLCSFLAGPGARMITGQVIPICGGYTAR